MEVLIAAAVALGSAIISANAKNLSEQQARALLERARNEFGQIDLPKLEELSAQMLPPTELAKIQTDPQYKQAQLQALDKLQAMSQGTTTLQDDAILSQALGKVARNQSAGREAIRGNMAARGMLGSGAEVAMALDNQQAGAQNARAIGLDVAAKAQQRAYDALMDRSRLAGQMDDREFARKQAAAQATDLINKYNATRESDARQQHFLNQVAITQAKNGSPVTGLIQSHRNDAANTAQTAGAIASGVNQAAGAYANYNQGQGNAYTEPTTGKSAIKASGISPEDEANYYDRLINGGN